MGDGILGGVAEEDGCERDAELRGGQQLVEIGERLPHGARLAVAAADHGFDAGAARGDEGKLRRHEEGIGPDEHDDGQQAQPQGVHDLKGIMFPREETLVLPPEAHCTYRAPLNVETRRRLTLALAITAVVMVVELIGGWMAGSLALLADAAHMLADVAALALALVAAWIAHRPAPPDRSFGFLRLEILAALINGAVLFAIAIGIGIEAWHRWRDPPLVNGALLLGVAAVGFGANLAAVIVLHRGHDHSLNQRGAYLHVLGDLLGSVGALVEIGRASCRERVEKSGGAGGGKREKRGRYRRGGS